MDLWLSEQLLVVLTDLHQAEQNWNAAEESQFVKSICHLLNSEREKTMQAINRVDSLSGLLDLLVSLRHEMDRSINNAALTRQLDVEVLASPGILVFRSAQQAAHMPGLRDVKITFLVDEFENLSLTQQRYFNTLIREKELPSCFLIGGREWGIRTHETLSAHEINKRGSEFEWKVLEDSYRTGNAYSEFCKNMVVSRLEDAGMPSINEKTLTTVFSRGELGRFQDKSLLDVLGSADSSDRPHVQKLRKSVLRATQDRQLTDSICKVLSVPEHPLIEKLAILRFYQQWNTFRSINIESAHEARDYVTPLLDGTESVELRNYLNLWKSDLIAQIYHENDRRNLYIGFDQFVDMSGYLPRSLLMILKYVTHWAIFFGERPFEGLEPISPEAQTAGVLDASRWFFSDAKPLGQEGEDCDLAIRRLGALLRAVRQSDKPAETGVTTFSSNLQRINPSAGALIETCVNHRLLIEIYSGRTSRNRGSVHRKFQLHPMLAPLFGLPTGRRGDLSLKPAEVSAIFGPEALESEYSRIVKDRVAGMHAPFSLAESQESLFELG
ncbi:hypothetical protein [Pseudarthrobacter sulfonivorans]|uniref:ORC-CDC6 family AAA ATPase n=1 Tax=Pseudarthrobacter sulfonivorans TaxID=121292 RepID=UPI00286129F1|nr:hypothetical protein [Pseudarthrobacter sulfonivorans]MDR6417724.1 hypothetical protein [Pseudarthrobacter sulfonivorans]